MECVLKTVNIITLIIQHYWIVNKIVRNASSVTKAIFLMKQLDYVKYVPMVKSVIHIYIVKNAIQTIH